MAKGELLHTYNSEKATVRIFAGERSETERKEVLKNATAQFAQSIRKNNPGMFDRIAVSS